MIQEIITYLIVAIAFLFAFWKLYKKFSKKKIKHNLKNEQQHNHLNCSVCSAECILRDKSAISVNKADYCSKTFTENS